MALQTKVGSFTKIDTTGSQAITGVGFTPKAIIIWTTGGITAGTWRSDAATVIGMTTGPTNSYACGAVSEDAAGVANTARRMTNKCITLPARDAASVTYEADLTSLDADGFTINWTTNSVGFGAGHQIMYMALGGSDITNAKVQNWQQPVATGNKAVTGVGFKPDLVFHAGNGGLITTTSSVLGFGVMNKHGQQWTNSVTAQDGANPTNTSRLQTTDACFSRTLWSETVDTQAHFSSMDTDGFTVNFSQTPGSNDVISLCLKGVSSKIGAFIKPSTAAPAAQSVTRVGFQPKSVMFTMIDAAAGSGALATSSWGLYATDGTNSRAAHFFDSDNTSPARAKSVYLNDRAVIGSIGTGAVTTDASATSTIKPDGFDLTWSPNDTGTAEIAYVALGDAAVDTYPSTVTVSTGLAATTAFSTQRKIDRNQDGTLWFVPNWSDNGGRLHYSKDNGKTWTYNGQSFDGWNNGSIFIDLDDNIHAVWKQSGTLGGRIDGYTYYMRGTPDAGRTSWTFSSGTVVYDQTGGNYADLIAHREGTGWAVHIVNSWANGINAAYANYWRITVTSGGVITNTNPPGIAIGGSYATTLHTFPTIDFNHTGDGKTVAGGTPHLYAGWSAGKNGAGFGIRFKKATYSGGSWAWGTERDIDTNYHIGTNQFWINCLFDGTRVIFPGMITDATTNEWMVIHERDAADTTTTTRYLTNPNNAPDGVINGSASYDASGNVYLIGRGEGYTGYYLNLYKWTRLSSTATRLLIEPNGGANTAPYVSAKRGWSNGRVEWVYTSGDNNPWAVKYDYVSTYPLGLFIKKVKSVTDIYRDKMRARGFNI